MGTMVRFFLLLAVTVSAVGFAQSVYRWQDAHGEIHYTDDPSTIPKGATVVATEGEPISEMGAPAPVRKIEPVIAQRDLKAAGNSTDPAVPNSSEQYWRGQFRAAREKIHSLEDELASDKHRIDENGIPVTNRYSCYPGYGNPVGVTNNGVVVGPVNGSPYGAGNCIATINPEYQRTKDRIDRNQRAHERAKEELHELERRASFEAVPNEWRR